MEFIGGENLGSSYHILISVKKYCPKPPRRVTFYNRSRSPGSPGNLTNEEVGYIQKWC